MMTNKKTKLTDVLNRRSVEIDQSFLENPYFSWDLLAQNKHIQCLVITHFKDTVLDLSFIASMPQLESLAIIPNKQQRETLKTIIFRAQQMLSLTRIKIIHNKNLNHIPKNIGFASNLQTLELQRNNLSGGMDELEGLPLTRLDLSDNQFTHFNHKLLHNWHLQHLNLSQNHISHIDTAPIQAGQIPLKTFYIYQNKLDKFNFTLANSTLQILSLSSNQLNHVPHCIADMQAIEDLSFAYNSNITELPSWLAELPLCGVGMSGLTRINWKSLTVLNHVSYLDVACCDISQIPDVIFTLQALKGLNLNYNNLEHIPQEISQLSQLEYIYVGSNELTQAPTALLACENLSSVYLELNFFSDIVYEQTVKLLKQAGVECETEV